MRLGRVLKMRLGRTLEVRVGGGRKDPGEEAGGRIAEG